MQLSTEQKNALDRMARSTFNGVDPNYPFSQLIQDIEDGLSAGAIGITSNAYDIDSITLGGGMFGRRIGADSGLTIGFYGGRLNPLGLAMVTVANFAVALSASLTNYIEVDAAGTVTKNTTGFTPGRYPLYTVLAGSSGFVESNVTKIKPLAAILPSGGFTGALLSTAMKTKIAEIPIPSISATTTIRLIAPSFAGKLSRVVWMPDATIAADNTNYWTLTIVNKQNGTGSVAMLDPVDANTTKLTGGSPLTADTPRVFTLHSTPGNLVTAADDGIQIVLTKTAAASNITGGTIKLEFGSDL